MKQKKVGYSALGSSIVWASRVSEQRGTLLRYAFRVEADPEFLGEPQEGAR